MMIKRPMCLLSFLFFLLMLLFLNISGGMDEKEYYTDGEIVTVTGTLSDKLKKDKSSSIYIDNVCIERCENNFGMEYNKRLNKVIVYLSDSDLDKLKIGQKVRVKGEFTNFELPENEGQFNMREYYRIRGYSGSVKKGIIESKTTNYSVVKNSLFEIKKRVEDVYLNNMEVEYAKTLSAMVLGDRRILGREVKDLYQTAGISHVLSLSGLHVSTIGFGTYSLFSAVGIIAPVASVLAIIIMVLYGIMTGMAVSTERALVMFVILLMAKLLSRTYDLLSAACLSSILILIRNPYYIYDSGFQMSFLSVVGIGMLSPIIVYTLGVDPDRLSEDITISGKIKGVNHVKNRFKYCWKKIINSGIYEKFAVSLSISISASLATLPVVMNSFYKTSRYSFLINIIVVPLMSVVLLLGITAGVFSCFLIKIRDLKFFIRLLLVIEQVILWFYTCVSEKVRDLPYNTWILGKTEKWRMVVYISLGVVLYLISNIKRKVRMKRMVYIGTVLLMLCILTCTSEPDFSANYLSVGQGACNIIYGKNVPTVIIDGGSSDVNEVGKYRIVPFLLSKGIKQIDYIFITHPDTDHISGIKEILGDASRDIKVRYMFLSIYNEELVKAARDRGIKVHIIHRGDEIRNKKMIIKCLSPEEGAKVTGEDSYNDLSLVLRVEYFDKKSNTAFIYPGDISSDVERVITEDGYRGLLDADVLSVAHHGSRYSSCEEFIKEVSPKLSVISAGKNNSYGHPHKETLERLDEYAPSARVLRTDECGQITIIVDKRVKVRQFRND